MKIKIKPKNILIDTLVVMAGLSLVGSLVIVLAGNISVYGVKSVQFALEEGNNIFAMQNFDVTSSYGEVGLLGIIIGVLSLALICFLSFYFTKYDHFYSVIGVIIPLVMILLPVIIKDNTFVNLIGYLGMLLYVNPFYTLISILPFTPVLSVYLGFSIILVLVLASTIIGIIINKLIIKEL